MRYRVKILIYNSNEIKDKNSYKPHKQDLKNSSNNQKSRHSVQYFSFARTSEKEMGCLRRILMLTLLETLKKDLIFQYVC